MSNKLLSSALEELHKLQQSSNIFKSNDFSGKNLTYLKKAGYIKPIIRGWYYQSHPLDVDGDSTSWYAGYWEFISKYLHERFGSDYALNPENSLLLHTKHATIPKQIVAITQKGALGKVKLLEENSIFIYPEKKAFPKDIAIVNGLNVYTLEEALCKVGKSFFSQNQEEIEIAFSMIKDVSGLLNVLLTRDRMDDATDRICGALNFFKRAQEARRIKETYESATFKNVSLVNPFKKEAVRLNLSRDKNPYALRLRSMWQRYKDEILKLDISAKKTDKLLTIDEIVMEMKQTYQSDAYHSLSIEGYKVSLELIDKVSSGKWNPQKNSYDESMKNALAAKGYYQAYEAVNQSVIESIKGKKEISHTLAEAHHKWYRELFAPSVQAGILKPHHLAGYRNHQVYIKGSMHVPFPQEAIVDAMEVYFELLADEKEPIVKAILGHHLFGFIHPYMDGNGRMARFIMNAILVSHNYPWFVIKVEDRDRYMSTLEEASVKGDIKPFTRFVLEGIL